LVALDDLILDAGDALGVELAEAGLAVLADRRVQAGGDPGEIPDRLDLVEGQLRLSGDLLLAGVSIEPRPELALHASNGPLPLRDVRGDPNRAAGVVKAA